MGKKAAKGQSGKGLKADEQSAQAFQKPRRSKDDKPSALKKRRRTGSQRCLRSPDWQSAKGKG
jgi:hypothetical protein